MISVPEGGCPRKNLVFYIKIIEEFVFYPCCVENCCYRVDEGICPLV